VIDDELLPELTTRQKNDLYRRRLVVEGPQATTLGVNGKTVVNFCSNDYLGLANHPVVKDAFKQGVDRYGVGAGASHLINGHSRAHQALEEELAEFVGRPRALLFSTGYMANLGVVSALLGRGDSVFEDRLNHASLIDAGLLSGARLQRYLHTDVDSLASYLSKREQQQPGRRKLIVTDGVFSMDGDIAPLPTLAKAAAEHDAWLMVDDAHGFGVLGDKGQGTASYYRLSNNELPILMGTLGKAVGTFGAFVAGSEALIETLIQQARSYIYTTALPPAVAEATRASLRLVQQESWRREKLGALIQRFRRGAAQLGLSLLDSATPIQPLLVGDSACAVQLSEALLDRDIMVSAIRPPTVPAGSARLRITFSAQHEEAQVDRLLAALESLA
jgi:8-amino-7-oxononanoate synthase